MAVFTLADFRKRMEKSVEVLGSEFAGLRTGRATASLLDPVVVDAYGSKMPLNQVATVTVQEARMLSVQVWDHGLAPAVDKAIRDSSLGLNPSAEGAVIRVPLPELNEERRKELSKVAHQYAESARVAVRHVRRDGMDLLKKLEKDGDIGKDEQHTMGEEIQKLTDGSVSAIDAALAAKEEEIMQV